MPTNTSLSLTLMVNKQPVTINTDSLDSLVFTLPTPINFGTWQDFETYLHDSWGVTIPPYKDTGVKALDDTYKTLTQGAQLKLTTVTINQPTATYEVGVSVEFKEDPNLLPGVQFHALGLKVRIEPEKFALPADLEKTANTLAMPDPAGEWVNAKQILIDKEKIDIAKNSSSNSWDLTRAQDSAELHNKGAKVLLWQKA
jgi:hypothetical protein